MIELTTTRNDDDSDYYVRIACPCLHLYQPDTLLQLNFAELSVPELAAITESAWRPILEAFRLEHPSGLVCPECGETSTLDEPPFLIWTNPQFDRTKETVNG